MARAIFRIAKSPVLYVNGTYGENYTFFHMTFGYLAICALLILACLAGILGLFSFQEYIRKISCLSVSYSSFLILMMILSLKNEKMNEVLIIMVSILAIFAVNLLIGIGIARNIAREKSRLAKDEEVAEVVKSA